MSTILHEDFESGQWTHNCKVFPMDEEPYETEIGNIFTPAGWTFWFRHVPGILDQPEARFCWKSVDPYRIHTGSGAYLFFSCWRRHDAGLMRQVQVEPGTQLRLTAWAHAWSNHPVEGHEDCADDARCSCGVGRGGAHLPEEDIPPLTGDPWDDAVGNAVFALGIDPTGGTNPFADTVVWGPVFAIYNEYIKQLEVETEATNSTITIFLRNVTQWSFKHNDAYWDDVELETAGGPPPYESTMLVLPQDATPEQLHEVFTLAYPNRRTFGFSHDDAGHLNGTAILYNIPDGEKSAYLDFYAGRYPTVEVKFAYTSDWGEPEIPVLWQCNPEWKNEKVAGPDCSMTLCQTGCWISDCAMAQRFFGIKANATPSTANQALGAVNGFSGCNTKWSAMPGALGLEVMRRSYDDSEAREWLDTGNICFAEVEPEDFTHFVLVTRYQGERFWMHDPYKNTMGWLDEYYPGAESWRLIRPFDVPPPPPPPPPIDSLLSLHLQSLVDGALDFVARAKPSVVKIFQLEVAKEIKARSPGTKVVLRYFEPHQNLDGDLHDTAREYIAKFRDSLAINHEWIDFVESYNETICSNNAGSIQRAVEFDCWFAEELMALGLPGIYPQLLNAPVGNPLEDEVVLLLPAVEQVIKYSGTIGYHAYGQSVNKSNLNDAWRHLAGRALEGWDPVFRSHGLYPHYIFGECGAFATCSDGWRSSLCLDGDWPLYLAQLTEFSDRIKAWNTTHSNRCWGGTLFTSGGWGWDTFEITKAEMEDPDWP